MQNHKKKKKMQRKDYLKYFLQLVVRLRFLDVVVRSFDLLLLVGRCLKRYNFCMKNIHTTFTIILKYLEGCRFIGHTGSLQFFFLIFRYFLLNSYLDSINIQMGHVVLISLYYYYCIFQIKSVSIVRFI